MLRYFPTLSSGAGLFSLYYNGVQVGSSTLTGFGNVADTQYEIKFVHEDGVGITLFLDGVQNGFIADTVQRGAHTYYGVGGRAHNATSTTQLCIFTATVESGFAVMAAA